MGHTALAYLAQLQALLPTGPAWPRHPNARLTKLLWAWAEELARVDTRLGQLIAEFDPRTAYELLDEWEAMLGLPDPCTGPGASIAARQALCWRKLVAAAGVRPADFVELAATLGFEVEIHEFDPDVDAFDPSLTALIAGGRYRYVFRVHVLNAGDFTYFRFGDDFGGRFREGDAALDLECILASVKPAHTHVIFSYPEV